MFEFDPFSRHDEGSWRRKRASILSESRANAKQSDIKTRFEEADFGRNELTWGEFGVTGVTSVIRPAPRALMAASSRSQRGSGVALPF
jgi:hypothetical protein